MQVLGIDIGGSGIKGALVNTRSGKMTTDRHRIATPQPATPKAVAKTVKALVKHFDWQGPIGCGFPAVVQSGVVRTASNIHKSWIGENAAKLFSDACGCSVTVNNDADAAGLAELRFGAGRGYRGIVLMITIGTGLGSALAYRRQIIPNSELGHLLFKGDIAENYAADSVRKEEDLSWKQWGKRFNKYLQHLEELFWPEVIILGGGASKKFDKFSKYLKTDVKIVPATLLNEAGIIGAAVFVKSSRSA